MSLKSNYVSPVLQISRMFLHFLLPFFKKRLPSLSLALFMQQFIDLPRNVLKNGLMFSGFGMFVNQYYK